MGSLAGNMGMTVVIIPLERLVAHCAFASGNEVVIGRQRSREEANICIVSLNVLLI